MVYSLEFGKALTPGLYLKYGYEYSFIVCRKAFATMVNLTEKVKNALTNTKEESALETEEIGELCMACGKDFASDVEFQKHLVTELGA